MVFKEDEEMRPQNAFLKPLAIVGLMLLGVFLSFHLFFSGFTSKTQTTQTQPTRTAQTQTITYEDLITEEKEPQEPPKEESKAIEIPKPKEQEPGEPKEQEPVGYYSITVSKTRPKTESIDLIPKEPKIIYLP